VLERQPRSATDTTGVPPGRRRQHSSQLSTGIGCEIDAEVGCDDREPVLDGSVHQVREVFDRVRQAVKTGDDDSVCLACTAGVERGVQPRPPQRAAGPFVLLEADDLPIPPAAFSLDRPALLVEPRTHETVFAWAYPDVSDHSSDLHGVTVH